MRLPLREHLRLLLAIAAEECMKLPEDPALREKRMLEAAFLAAKSVARTPDHLLRTIDRLGAAGWDFAAVELPALRDVEARFQRQLADCGFELIHTADRRALNQISTSPPIFANILVIGFIGADATEQAEAIASVCVRFLAEEKCTRIGMVFSDTGSLPRLVASALSKFAIPHNDGFGHPVPGLFESAEWLAWLQLLRGRRVNSLLRFLGALR